MEKKDYLQTPDKFKNHVQSLVEEQLKEEAKESQRHTESFHMKNHQNTGSNKSYDKKGGAKKLHWKRTALVAAIAVMAIGTSVFAAYQYRLSQTVPVKEAYIATKSNVDQRVSIGLPEELSRFDMEESKNFTDALVDWKEVYYDGTTLYFYGVATDAGADYECGSERVFINDMQYFAEIRRTCGDDSREGFATNEYFGKCELDSQITDDNFTVEIPLMIHKYLGENYTIASTENDFELWHAFDENFSWSDWRSQYADLTDEEAAKQVVWPEYEKFSEDDATYLDLLGVQGYQTISVDVTAVNSATVMDNKNITISDTMSLDATQIIATDGGMRMELCWTFSGEDAKAYADNFNPEDGTKVVQFMITDDQGNTYNTEFEGRGSNGVSMADADGINPDAFRVEQQADGSYKCYYRLQLDKTTKDVKNINLKAWVPQTGKSEPEASDYIDGMEADIQF